MDMEKITRLTQMVDKICQTQLVHVFFIYKV